MVDIRTGKELKDIPILEEPQLRLYVMLNQEGKVKIGKTKNIYQRYQSLCGSNSQGVQITSVCCSPPTYLYSLENIMHEKFNQYRIPKTEWFYNKEDMSGTMLFKSACEELKLLFSSADYKKCNETRKMFSKAGGINDN